MIIFLLIFHKIINTPHARHNCAQSLFSILKINFCIFFAKKIYIENIFRISSDKWSEITNLRNFDTQPKFCSKVEITNTF